MRCNLGLTLLALVFLGIPAGPCLGDEAADKTKAAEGVLAEKGLRKASGGYVLADEVRLSKMLGEASALQKKVVLASRELGLVEKKEQASQKAIVDMFQMRSAIRAQLTNTNNVKQQNKLVLQLSELGDRIAFLQEGKDLKKEIQDVRAKFNGVRESYVQHLLDMRKLADQLMEKYADLAADPQVTEALATLAPEGAAPVELAASKSLETGLRGLKKLEDKVLSETIKLTRTPGNIYMLSVVFQEKFTEEIGIDTGSSVVCLPWAMAKRTGLVPGPSAATVKLQLADGSVIEGKQVTAPSVRVGKFTVENVECVVLPENLPNAAPLLGMSFLQYFSYKINSETDELAMTKVETPEDRRAPKKK